MLLFTLTCVCTLIEHTKAISDWFIIQNGSIKWNDAQSHCSHVDPGSTLFGRDLATTTSETYQKLTAKCSQDLCLERGCWVSNKQNDSWIQWCAGNDTLSDQTDLPIAIHSVQHCWMRVQQKHQRTTRYCTLCGPPKYASLSWWVVNIYSVVGILFICCYSAFVAKSLHRDWYKTHYNFILRPSETIKITSVMIPALLACSTGSIVIGCLMYIICFLVYDILPPTSLIHWDSDKTHYPFLFNISGFFLIIGLVFYFFVSPLMHYHMLLRIKNAFDDNCYMKSVINPQKCKYFYECMVVLLLLSMVFAAIAICLSGFLSGSHHTGYRVSFIVLFLVTNIVINSVLVILYIKALHVFAFNHYFQYNKDSSNSINDRQHELALKATQYCTLFGWSMLFNIIFTLVAMVVLVLETTYVLQYDRSIIVAMYNTGAIIKEYLMVQSLHLSFPFSHLKYKQICCFCDRIVKNLCERIIIYRNNKAQKYCETYYEKHGIYPYTESEYALDDEDVNDILLCCLTKATDKNHKSELQRPLL